MSKQKITHNNEPDISSTIYDDVFRTLITDCPSLLIPVLNEFFHHNIEQNTKVQVLQNEVFLSSPDGNQKRITDSNLLINALRYHVECQTTPDKTIYVRIWEYDSQIALQEINLNDTRLTVRFPHTAVLYLRHYSTTPDTMQICIQVPGDECSYEIPAIKIQRYTVDEIFEKELYLFIPYHIFTYESKFKQYDKDEQQLKELKKIFQNIRDKLEQAKQQEKINDYIKHILLDMTQRVIDKISKNHKQVKEGLGKIMGGKVLEHDAKKFLNQGLAEGFATGRLESIVLLLKDDLEIIAINTMHATEEELAAARKMIESDITENNA